MQSERPSSLFARHALTAGGWQQDVEITFDNAGTIAGVQTGAPAKPDAVTYEVLLPGLANVHSHSFQRAMAGLTETASSKEKDNFWTWRHVMYHFAQRLTPEQVETITRALYIELLQSGFTAVGEFHYLHHDVEGRPYAAVGELSDRIASAALVTGIHLTHLPVMYEAANFGGVPPSEGQRRFIHTADRYIDLLEALVRRYRDASYITLGVAPHSLRAVTPESLAAILDALPKLGLSRCPIHIHVSEQEKEVSDCLAWSTQRPVEWLFNHCNVDSRWCLIHATHINQEECQRIADSGAVAGLCPTTEANLGDGIFPIDTYLIRNGKFGIGTDSHIGVSPWEELRLLEYHQRLKHRRRAVLYDENHLSIGRTLFTRAAAGGAQALGLSGGVIAPGRRADLISLSMDEPLLAGKQGDQILDTLVFAGIRPPIDDVYVAGRRVITGGRHPLAEESRKALRRVLGALSNI